MTEKAIVEFLSELHSDMVDLRIQIRQLAADFMYLRRKTEEQSESIAEFSKNTSMFFGGPKT